MYADNNMDEKVFETVYAPGNTYNSNGYKPVVLYLRGNGESRLAMESKIRDMKTWAMKNRMDVVKAFVDGPGSDPVRVKLRDAIHFVGSKGIEVLLVEDMGQISRFDTTVGAIEKMLKEKQAWVRSRR